MAFKTNQQPQVEDRHWRLMLPLNGSNCIKTQHQITCGKTHFKRKELCPSHDLKLRFHCEYVNCQFPYLCNHQDCLDMHFHEGNLNLSKFDFQQYRIKIQRVQKLINENELGSQFDKIYEIVEKNCNSIADIFKDLDLFNYKCDALKKCESQSIYSNELDQLIAFEQDITKKINAIKLDIQGHDKKEIHYFKMKAKLQRYLKEHIQGFSYDTCVEIVSTKGPCKPSDKFHELLQGKSNLLFLFVGEREIIGSYFPDPYPNIQQKTLRSVNSFIFYHSGEDGTEFVKFKANPNSEHHLQISEKLIICHGNTPSCGDGVRTFQRNFEGIDYYLPSKTYLPVETGQKAERVYSGKIKPASVVILHIKK